MSHAMRPLPLHAAPAPPRGDGPCQAQGRGGIRSHRHAAMPAVVAVPAVATSAMAAGLPP